jgi:hypothetical protein
VRRDASSKRTTAYKRGYRPPCARSPLNGQSRAASAVALGTAASSSFRRLFPSRDRPRSCPPRPRDSFPIRLFACSVHDLAGAGASVAGAGCHHRATPLPPPPLQASAEIEPWDFPGRPPPAPGRSRPPVRRNFAGPPPAGARGTALQAPNSLQGLNRKSRVYW